MVRLLFPVAVLAALLACTPWADKDDDGDGLLNGAEEEAGTDPLAADSDGDGLSDSVEVDTGTDPSDPDSDADGIEDADEAGAGTDPLDADSDDDGLTDGAELDEIGSDPTAADSDGDGYLDGDEVTEGTDPSDDSSVIYQGGWPYQADKDSFEGPALEDAELGEGERFARLQVVDQFGETFDLYDLAGHGKPILVDISAIWCGPCNGLSEWLSGKGDSYGYDGSYGNIKDMVDSGDMHWVTILGQNVQGKDPSLASIQAWDTKYPNERIPVLVGDNDIANVYVTYAWPSAFFLDENMVIVAMPSGVSAGHYDALDAANNYEP